MDLLEHQGTELFRHHGIPTPASTLYTGDDIAPPDSEKIVVKAQIPAGKREEHGGIKIVDRDDALQAAQDMHGTTIEGETVDSVLLEAAVDIQNEYYISLSIDRAGKGYRLVFSEQGGSGIEERADDAITLDFTAFDEDLLQQRLTNAGIEVAEQIATVASRMADLMRQEDALLVEINPLVLTHDGDLMAVDSKVRIDDSALFRHEDLQEESESAETLEEKASKRGLEFVDLEGSIGVIGNGAGLVMATLDSINHFGGSPANFLDIGGGADIETMTAAMTTVLAQDDVKGLFVNIFGGITRCDHVAQGIIDFVEEEDIDLPLVVRMVGTNQEEGKQMLEDHGIEALDSMDECARSIVEMTGGGTGADR